MRKKDLPIGVFDSGVGGISVLRCLTRQMPHEDFIYAGDSANAPYGTRTPEEILRLTLLQTEKLKKQGVKALVIACNTATSAAISDLRKKYADIPVIGIEPALKPATLVKEHPLVLVLATPATVAGDKFLQQVQRFEHDAVIRPVGCPGLVEYVEKGQTDTPQVRALVRELLTPFLAQKPDAIVLGCTHYPFLTGAIREVVGEGPAILDGGEGTARHTCHLLAEGDLLSDRKRAGQVMFDMSLPGQEALCRQLLQDPQ